MHHPRPPKPPPPFPPRSHLKSATARTLLRLLSLSASADSTLRRAAAPSLGHFSGAPSHSESPASAATLGNCAQEKNGGVSRGEGAIAAAEEESVADCASGAGSEKILEFDRCLVVGELIDGCGDGGREELGNQSKEEAMVSNASLEDQLVVVVSDGLPLGHDSGAQFHSAPFSHSESPASALTPRNCAPEKSGGVSCSEGATAVEEQNSADFAGGVGAEKISEYDVCVEVGELCDGEISEYDVCVDVTTGGTLSKEEALVSNAILEYDLDVGVLDELRLREGSHGIISCSDVQVEDVILDKESITEVNLRVDHEARVRRDGPVLSGELEQVEWRCINSPVLIGPEIGDLVMEGNPVYDNKPVVDGNKPVVDDVEIGVDIVGNELQHECNVFGIAVESEKNIGSCRVEEISICNQKNRSINMVEDGEIEEGEISDDGDLDTRMDSFSEMETELNSVGIAGDLNRKYECNSVDKEIIGLDLPLAKSKCSSFSETCDSRVKFNSLLSEQTDGINLFPGDDGAFISRNGNPGNSIIRGNVQGSEVHICSLGSNREGFDKSEVPSAANALTKKHDRVCEKKKRGSVSEGRKAKNKLAKKRKRAEMNKKLGVKRLKLVPVSKPKVVQICQHYLKGRCRQADKCKYSHDAVPLTKSQPCKYFACNSCLKGDDCPFDHQLSKYPCHNFVSKGSCIRGDSCLFSHKVKVAEDPSTILNASKEKCLLALEKTNLVNELRVNSNPQLAPYSLLKNGTISSQSSSLEKSSLSQQPSDISSAKKLDPLTVKTPPRGITFLSLGGGKVSSLDERSNDKKDFESNLSCKSPSEGKMALPPSSLRTSELSATTFCKKSPTSSQKMIMLPFNASNVASTCSGGRGIGMITSSPAAKLQSGNMDASQMLEEFLFGGG